MIEKLNAKVAQCTKAIKKAWRDSSIAIGCNDMQAYVAESRHLYNCRHGSHKDVKVAYGYPAYKQVWENVFVCKHCRRVLIEKDDLFGEPRRVVFPKVPLHKPIMNEKSPGILRALGISHQGLRMPPTQTYGAADRMRDNISKNLDAFQYLRSQN